DLVRINGGIMMDLPKELLYSKEHEWVKKENGKVRIGITDFAQDELGDVVFVELTEVGDEVEVDERNGCVEAVKTASELYTHLSGQGGEINQALEDSYEFINESPYDKAWMIVLAVADESELDNLL